MISRNLNVLLATTAFVAATAGANAADLTGTLTSLQSLTADAANTTTAAQLTTTGTAAIDLGYAGATSLAVDADSVISSDDATQTIGMTAGHSVTGLTITNAGTIANTGTGAAINTSAQDSNPAYIGAAITNTGTISGSITLGDAVNSIANTGGTIRGDITGAATVADTFNITANGVVVGDIDLGSGANVMTINSSTVTGDIVTTGTDGNTFTLTNAVVNGTISNAAAGGGDVLTIGGTNTFTTGGAISGIETVNLNTNTVLNHGLSGVDALTLAASKTLTVNNSFALASGGTLTNNGTLSIAAGKTVDADTYTAGAGSTLAIAVSDSTHAGQLITAGGVTATSLTVALSSSAGYITSGTTLKVIDGAATSSATLLTANTGVYRYSLTRTNTDQDVNLVIGRVATADVVEGTSAKAAAAALDALGNGGTSTLDTLQSNIGSASTAAAVNSIVQSLTPSIDGVGAAGLGVAQATGNQVSNRLAMLRREGVAAGDAAARDHVWVQGYGSHAKQDTKAGTPGYSANSGGASLGVDTDAMVDGVTTGVAFSYGSGNVKSDAAGSAKTEFDSYAATLYGSRVLDAGVFVNGQVGFGYNKYDMTRDVAGVGQAKGDTHGYQGTAKVEAGKDFKVEDFTLTPMAGVQYTHLDVKKYTETGAGGASLIVDPKAMDAVDLSLGGQASYDFAMGNGNTLKPAVRAKYVYHAGDTSLATSSRFVGGGSAFATDGAKADRSGVDLGAGLTFASAAGVDLSLDYDADIRSNLTAQTGQLKARYAF